MRYYEKEYCTVCGEENPQDQEICKCGGRNFIYGDNFTFVNKEYKCNCGETILALFTHINTSPIHSYTYLCRSCHNPIGIQNYYKSEYDDIED